MRKEYKYQADIDEITKVCNCPNSEYFSFGEKEAFRFVFEDINHPNNFSPPAKIKPARYLSKSEREKCDGLGLSLYANKNGARNKFNELITTFENLQKLLMGCRGFLPYNQGVYSLKIDKSGNSVYAFTTDNMVNGVAITGESKETKFNIIEEL